MSMSFGQPRRQPRNKNKVYSVYHRMAEEGVFDENPANPSAVNPDGISIYKGPVEYPKMLFHPKGEYHVINQGIAATDPRTNMPIKDENGKPIRLGEVRDMINRVVNTPEEEAALIAEGWHRTPGDALRCAPPGSTPYKAPEMTPLEKAQKEIADLKALLSTTTREAAKKHG